MSKYPECEKMSAISKESQQIGEFLEWLQYDKDIILSKYGPTPYGTQELYPMKNSIEGLLADYYEIDMKKVEEERNQMLEELRNKK